MRPYEAFNNKINLLSQPNMHIIPIPRKSLTTTSYAAVNKLHKERNSTFAWIHHSNLYSPMTITTIDYAQILLKQLYKHHNIEKNINDNYRVCDLLITPLDTKTVLEYIESY